MVELTDDENWDEIGVEDMDDVAEIQDLLMEDISSDDDSDSDPEEMLNALMEDNDLSDDDLIVL